MTTASESVAQVRDVVSTKYKRELTTIALIGMYIGFAWLLGAPSRTSGNGNDAARWLFSWLPWYPMRTWGAILIALKTAVLVSLYRCNERAMIIWLSVLMGYWLFWTMLSLGAVMNHKSLSGPAFYAIWVAVQFPYIRSAAVFRKT